MNRRKDTGQARLIRFCFHLVASDILLCAMLNDEFPPEPCHPFSFTLPAKPSALSGRAGDFRLHRKWLSSVFASHRIRSLHRNGLADSA